MPSPLVGTGKRFGFLDLHLEVAAFEATGASLVAEHFGAALFAHVTLAEHVRHLYELLKNKTKVSL
jgi:hypothetical protein